MKPEIVRSGSARSWDATYAKRSRSALERSSSCARSVSCVDSAASASSRSRSVRRFSRERSANHPTTPPVVPNATARVM